MGIGDRGNYGHFADTHNSGYTDTSDTNANIHYSSYANEDFDIGIVNTYYCGNSNESSDIRNTNEDLDYDANSEDTVTEDADSKPTVKSLFAFNCSVVTHASVFRGVVVMPIMASPLAPVGVTPPVE